MRMKDIREANSKNQTPEEFAKKHGFLTKEQLYEYIAKIAHTQLQYEGIKRAFESAETDAKRKAKRDAKKEKVHKLPVEAKTEQSLKDRLKDFQAKQLRDEHQLKDLKIREQVAISEIQKVSRSIDRLEERVDAIYKEFLKLRDLQEATKGAMKRRKETIENLKNQLKEEAAEERTVYWIFDDEIIRETGQENRNEQVELVELVTLTADRLLKLSEVAASLTVKQLQVIETCIRLAAASEKELKFEFSDALMQEVFEKVK